MIDLGLAGKRALVSGAGYIPERAGHGRLTALRFAEVGATVACVDIDEGRAHGTVEAIESAGGKAFAVVADMTERDQVENAVAEATGRMGGLDICADIIGGAMWDPATEVSAQHWTWAIQNNLTQVFHLFQVAGARMAEQGTGGSIVALASVDGIAAALYHAPYGAAKAGVISLVKTFSQELGAQGIRVNAVAPGNVGSGNEDQPENEFGTSPINPLAAPRARDIANAALFLSSALAERITGQTLVVDGGATVRELWGFTAEMLPRLRTQNY